jgi:hypothetical protein
MWVVRNWAEEHYNVHDSGKKSRQITKGTGKGRVEGRELGLSPIGPIDMQQGVSRTDDTSNSNGCEEGIEVVVLGVPEKFGILPQHK